MVYAGNNMVYRKKSELEQYEEYDRLQAIAAPFLWMPKEQIYDGTSQTEEYISFLRKIGANNAPVGYMRVHIRTGQLSAELQNLVRQAGKVAYIYGGNPHEIIACTDTEEACAVYDAMDKAGFHGEGKGSWNRINSISGAGYFVCEKTIAGTDWNTVFAISVRELRRDIMQLILFWLLIIFVVSLQAFYLAYRLAGNITGRIRLLEKNMAHLAEGQFEKMKEDNYQDEISGLIRHYNRAINEMLSLHEKRYESMKKLKSAELRLLQSQINPHFLYNTLDLIRWEALEASAERISDITQSLARFYRLSLNEGKEFVSIRVENAILHGILEKSELKGAELEIYGWRDNSFVFLQISDNGVGMDGKKLNGIFEKSAPQDNYGERCHGFGVWNIQERLRLIYGEDCGLSYESIPGEGTSVVIKVRSYVQIDI